MLYSFITTHIDQWLAHEKPNNVNMSITFDSPEHDTMSGSACCVTVRLDTCAIEDKCSYIMTDCSRKGASSSAQSELSQHIRHVGSPSL